MLYDITERVKELRDYYEELLDRKIEHISKLSGVDTSQMVKINPADFIEKNQYQKIDYYNYIKIDEWIKDKKTDDATFLISPLDADEETAQQIAYKTDNKIERKLRASKCEVVPVPKELALDFFIRNHRQSPPHISQVAISLGLTYNEELIAVMVYDIQNGAVRGSNINYELLRLAISRNTRVHGGASKLQTACEDVLRQAGVKEIYSYSNATINSGAVYKALGFQQSDITGGQPFVMMEDNTIQRLINLYPNSTDKKLAQAGRIKTHVGGNRFWKKSI